MSAVQRGTSRRKAQSKNTIRIAFLCAVPSFFAVACRSDVPLSKPPILSEIDAAVVLRYVQEFKQMGEKGYVTPVSLDFTPVQPRQVYSDLENSKERDFFQLRLRDNISGDSRLLFTLWAADLGSGLAATVRWSRDGKALQIRGKTKGFSYEPVPEPDPSKFESFNFIYLVDEDKMYSAPREGSQQ